MESLIETRPIQASDCNFTAEVEFQSNGENAKTGKLRVLARTSEPIEAPGWGAPVVHDFAGMQHRNRISVDYNHNREEIIGYMNSFSVEADGLYLSGALTPFTADDRASEVVAKMAAGVPYEASISFPGPHRVEFVEDGQVAFANGREYVGPVAIVREWMLRSVAITTMGQDHQTRSDMFNAGPTVPATVFKKALEMSESTETVETPEVVETETVEDSTEAVEAVEVPAGEEVEAVEAVEAGASAELAVSDGQRFLDAFGDQGGVWFAQGRTFEDAQVEYISGLRQQNEQLQARIAELEKSEQGAAFSVNEAEPNEFSAAKHELKKRTGMSDLQAGLVTAFESRFGK